MGVMFLVRRILPAIAAVLIVAASAFAFEMQAFQMREDYATEPLSDCMLQYYYFIPCPTYSWFWAIAPSAIDVMGAWFEIGDASTGGFQACDPVQCHSLTQLRILDFGGYGTVYPGIFTVAFDVFCSDERGCLTGPCLWTSEPVETHFGWNYVPVEPPLSLCSCITDPGPPPAAPRIAIIARGLAIFNLAYGFDNISTALEEGCLMHDEGCLPALYPRPQNSHYPTVHSGYYGEYDNRYCPPIWFADGRDTTDDYSQFGHIEMAWRIYLACTGPSAGEPSSWGSIKSMYR